MRAQLLVVIYGSSTCSLIIRALHWRRRRLVRCGRRLLTQVLVVARANVAPQTRPQIRRADELTTTTICEHIWPPIRPQLAQLVAAAALYQFVKLTAAAASVG